MATLSGTDYLVNEVAIVLELFLKSSAKRMDFPWGCIYRVGGIIRIDIKSAQQS